MLLVLISLSSWLRSWAGRPLWLQLLSARPHPRRCGVAYEVMKFSASHRNWPIVGLLVAPGLWLQRLTTREPDRSMLEVSIAALKAVLEAEAQAPQAHTVAEAP